MIDTETKIGDETTTEAANTAPLTDEELVCFATMTNNRHAEPADLLDYLNGFRNTWWQPNSGFQVVAVRTLVEHQLVCAKSDLPVFSLTEDGRRRVAATMPLWSKEVPQPETSLVVIDAQEDVSHLV